MKVLGVDPGKISGWAIVEACGDYIGVHSWGEAMKPDDRLFAIEQAAIHGVTAMYIENSGNFGFVRATLSLAGQRARWDELGNLFLPQVSDIQLVMPKSWQHRLGYDPKGKEDTKAFSRRLTAEALDGLTTNEHIADAACIALFGILDQQHPKQPPKPKKKAKRKPKKK